MNNDTYVPQDITSKSDIVSFLENNIESYKKEAKDILSNSDFTHNQQQDLYNIMDNTTMLYPI